MNVFHPTHRQFLFAMLDAGVEFMLIGGYAVVYHGYVRSTGDMDVWLRPDNENKKKLLAALAKVDIEADDLKHLDKTFDFSDTLVFHFGMQPERIDFLTKVQGVNFKEAYERKNYMDVEGRNVPVLHLDDLIVTKLLAGRLQDKADVDMLQQINKNKIK